VSGRLVGKVAILTGGAQGIGRAIVSKLAQAGARVVVGDLHPSDGQDHQWHELDVTSEASVKAFTEAVADSHGGIDILVNNAGIMFEKTLEEQSADDWDRMMAINLRGPFLMAKHSAPWMRSRGGGAIVNLGSIEGFAVNPAHTAYAASKGGVHGLTVALAVDLGGDGIRCNAIAPGWIDTELNRAYVESHPNPAKFEGDMARLHPIGHIGAPADIGDVAVWLASDESRFVTGELITVDGGRTRKLSLPALVGR